MTASVEESQHRAFVIYCITICKSEILSQYLCGSEGSSSHLHAAFTCRVSIVQMQGRQNYVTDWR
jgi:hypothetical protein